MENMIKYKKTNKGADMEFMEQDITEMYNRENGKLILDFDDERYYRYLQIINDTPQYKEILDSVPQKFSDLEKAYYIYVNLGKLLHENLDLAYNHLQNLEVYYDVIKENGIGNCRQMNELFASMLKYKNIIKEFFLVRKPEGVEGIDLRHIDVIMSLNDKKYMFNIKGDIDNLRVGIRASHFGFTDSKIRKIQQISIFLHNNGLTEEKVEELLEKIEYSDLEDVLKEAKKYEREFNIKDLCLFLRHKVPKIKFIQQIEEEFGKLDEIPIKSTKDKEVSIESLDKKVNNTKHYNNIGFPFEIQTDEYEYFEDIIIFELIPRLIEKNSRLREEWKKSKNIFLDETFDESLEIDMDIILEFINQIAPRMEQNLLQECIRRIISEIYKERYKYSNKNFNVWAQKNIKLFRMTSKENLKKNNKNIPLRHILAIRKLDSFKGEKYIFYELIEEGIRKKSYREFIEELRIKEMRTCSKFVIERKETLDDLEI